MKNEDVMTINSTGPTPFNPITTVQPPVYKREEYALTEIVLKFFDERLKEFVKVLGYSTYWIRELFPNLPPEVKSFGTMMSNIKNFISVTEIPKKTNEALEALSGFCVDLTKSEAGKKVSQAALQAIKKLASLTSAGTDTFDFATNFIPQPNAAVASAVKVASVAATLCGASISAGEQVEKMANTKANERTKNTFNMMNLARDVSYVAFGILASLTMGGLITVAPSVPVVFLTAGLALSISSYFYEKIYDPEGKGKNLNPDTVIKNNLDRKAYEQRTV
jgi:hypothetical protein